MPIELKPKTSLREAAHEETQGLMLFNEDGELTLAGETIADFLSTADFSSVMESEAALPFLSNPAACDEDPYVGIDEGKKEDAESADDDSSEEADEDSDDGGEIAEVALPGAVAARLVDEGDLTEMFGYYLDQLAENEDPTLQEQATLAVFADYRDVDGGIDEDYRAEVSELLLSVLAEGVVYDAAEEIDERIMTKGARRKATKIRNRPKSGSRRAELKKRRRVEGRGAKKAKIGRQHKMRSRKKQSRIKQLARESEEGTLVFGLGEGINGAELRIGLAESPNMRFTDAQLVEFDVLSGNEFECPDPDCGISSPVHSFVQEAKKMKKKAKKKDADGDYDDSDSDEKYEGACPECGEMIESMLDEKGKVPAAFLKHTKKKGGDDDDDKDDDKPDFLKKKGKKDEGIAPGVFAVAAGRPNLSEGHSLAAATLGIMGGRKPVLTEDEG